MRQAAALLTGHDRQRINQAVAEAESWTSVEIVPVVAKASGRYDRAEDIVGLWTAILFLLGTWSLTPADVAESGAWGVWPPWTRPALLALAVVAGFVVGTICGARLDWLRSLFAPTQQKRDEVSGRSRQAFFDARVHHTGKRTGFLIYVSLFERMGAIVADQAVVEKLGQPALDELRDQLMRDLRDQSLADALCNSIAAAGRRLAPGLPRADDDVNELPDALVMLDG